MRANIAPDPLLILFQKLAAFCIEFNLLTPFVLIYIILDLLYYWLSEITKTISFPFLKPLNILTLSFAEVVIRGPNIFKVIQAQDDNTYLGHPAYFFEV